jgi:hypothetical protein
MYAGQGFLFATNTILTQFGFYGGTIAGGVFKFFIADASNTVVYSDVKTIGPTTTPTLLLTDVFSLALAAGSTYSFGIIGSSDADLQQTFFFPTISLTQNGVTNSAANSNWSNFAAPTRALDGGATMAMELFGTGGTTVIPEPASLMLVGTGLAGVFGVARRRRRNG